MTPLTEKDYRAWAKWRKSGGHPSLRPERLPRAIPKPVLQAWTKRYHEEHPPKPVNPFNGPGLFTAWDPGVILRKRPRVDWVAVTTDLFHGKPGCSEVMAAQIRSAGYRLFVWESRMEQGEKAALDLQAVGYIGQAESETELGKCLALKFRTPMPRGIVGNPVAWLPGSVNHVHEQGWHLLIECYWNTMPWLPPNKVDSKGLPVSSYVYGLYDASSEGPHGSRRLLSEYKAALAVADWSGYTAEALDERDWVTIGAR